MALPQQDLERAQAAYQQLSESSEPVLTVEPQSPEVALMQVAGNLSQDSRLVEQFYRMMEGQPLWVRESIFGFVSREYTRSYQNVARQVRSFADAWSDLQGLEESAEVQQLKRLMRERQRDLRQLERAASSIDSDTNYIILCIQNREFSSMNRFLDGLERNIDVFTDKYLSLNDLIDRICKQLADIKEAAQRGQEEACRQKEQTEQRMDWWFTFFSNLNDYLAYAAAAVGIGALALGAGGYAYLSGSLIPQASLASTQAGATAAAATQAKAAETVAVAAAATKAQAAQAAAAAAANAQAEAITAAAAAGSTTATVPVASGCAASLMAAPIVPIAAVIGLGVLGVAAGAWIAGTSAAASAAATTATASASAAQTASAAAAASAAATGAAQAATAAAQAAVAQATAATAAAASATSAVATATSCVATSFATAAGASLLFALTWIGSANREVLKRLLGRMWEKEIQYHERAAEAFAALEAQVDAIAERLHITAASHTVLEESLQLVRETLQELRDQAEEEARRGEPRGSIAQLDSNERFAEMHREVQNLRERMSEMLAGLRKALHHGEEFLQVVEPVDVPIQMVEVENFYIGSDVGSAEEQSEHGSSSLDS